MALDNFDKALRLQPYNAELINNRASALTEAKRYEEALAGYDNALARSNYADAHNNRGCVLMEMQRFTTKRLRVIARRSSSIRITWNSSTISAER